MQTPQIAVVRKLDHVGPEGDRRDFERSAAALAPHARGADHLPGRQNAGDTRRLLPRFERENGSAQARRALEGGAIFRFPLPLRKLLRGGREGRDKDQ